MTDKDKLAIAIKFLESELSLWEQKPHEKDIQNILGVLKSNTKENTLSSESWDWECDDGCCYEYGERLYLNESLVADEGTLSKCYEVFLENLGYKIEYMED